MRKSYNFVNRIEEESAELYIDGEIVEEGWEREFLSDWGVKSTSSNEFTDMLKDLNGKPLKIHCNSQGGSLFAGTAMYCALINYKGKKTGYIDSKYPIACALVAQYRNENKPYWKKNDILTATEKASERILNFIFAD